MWAEPDEADGIAGLRDKNEAAGSDVTLLVVVSAQLHVTAQLGYLGVVLQHL